MRLVYGAELCGAHPLVRPIDMRHVAEMSAQPMVPPRILVVDGNSATRPVLQRSLAGLSAELVEAWDAAGALDAARTQDFALILIRHPITSRDGIGDYETLRRLRRLPRTEFTPILLLVGAAPPPALLTSLGAVEPILEPPLDTATLQQKVRLLLELDRQRVELRQLAAQVQDQNRQLLYENQRFRAASDELVHQATHDPLTGLPNRALFADRLMSAIQRSRRHRRMFALAYVDLDGFKGINDEFGHAAGDEVLIEVAQRLGGRLRASDTIARLSGDEFGIILDEIDGAASAARVGRELLEILLPGLSLPLQTSSGQDYALVSIGASIGIALYPADATEPDGLLMLADRAMYRAKQRGGGMVQLHIEPPRRR